MQSVVPSENAADKWSAGMEVTPITAKFCAGLTKIATSTRIIGAQCTATATFLGFTEASAGKTKLTKHRPTRPSCSWIYQAQSSPTRLNLMSSTQATINASSTPGRTTRATIAFSSCLKGKTVTSSTRLKTFPTNGWPPGAAVPRLDTVSAITKVLATAVMSNPTNLEKKVLGPGTTQKWDRRELSNRSTSTPTLTCSTQASPSSTNPTALAPRTLSRAIQAVM